MDSSIVRKCCGVTGSISHLEWQTVGVPAAVEGLLFSALPLNLGQFWHRTHPRGPGLLSCPLLIRLSFEQAQASITEMSTSPHLTLFLHPVLILAPKWCQRFHAPACSELPPHCSGKVCTFPWAMPIRVFQASYRFSHGRKGGGLRRMFLTKSDLLCFGAHTSQSHSSRTVNSAAT